MRRLSTLFLLLLTLGLGAGDATALGLGKVSSAVPMGQPLAFIIGLRQEPGEKLEARCIKAEVSFGDRVLPESAVRTRIETSPSTGEQRVRVSTSVPVDEPIVGVNLHLGCPASLSRNFMVFADPPVRNARAGEQAGEQASDDNWTSDRPESAVAPILAAAGPASQAAASTEAASRGRKRRADVRRVDGQPEAAEPATRARAADRVAAAPSALAPARTRPAARPARPKGGPVLRLDPVEAESLVSPSLQMATSLSQVPDAAASGAALRYVDPEVAQRQQEQERLKAMETALLKLRSDSQATQKSLADMQARVRAAEASRYANPLVYLLTALCLVLAAGLAGMWWLRRRDRQAAAWWTASAEAAAAAQVALVPDEEPLSSMASKEPAPAPEPAPRSAPPRPSPPVAVAEAVRTPEHDVSVVEPRRPMSAEELIDLEQQAEFFVVLGQDDAAIDLLMGHVRSTGGVSPLPYLKLLEIYRRRGEREPYDRIRERFNRRFNAYAPEWDVDPEQGLSLDGYPEVMHKLQDTWERPSQAMGLLDSALFRRNAGPTFDVPAYRELLFLYGMARDLAEHDVSPDGVDLLLPMDADEFTTMSPVSASPAATAAAAATAGAQATVETLEPFSLDLDVSTDQPAHLSLQDPDFKRNTR